MTRSFSRATAIRPFVWLRSRCACIAKLSADAEVLISAGTVAEALVVAARRDVAEEMSALIDGFGFDIVPVTAIAARRIGAAYEKWRKGVHAAGLNFGDCFAYDVAKDNACGLLFVGSNFSKTDVKKVL